MDRIIADKALRRTFLDFTHRVEVCDEAGHVLARVIPVLDPGNTSSNPRLARKS